MTKRSASRDASTSTPAGLPSGTRPSSWSAKGRDSGSLVSLEITAPNGVDGLSGKTKARDGYRRVDADHPQSRGVARSQVPRPVERQARLGRAIKGAGDPAERMVFLGVPSGRDRNWYARHARPGEQLFADTAGTYTT